MKGGVQARNARIEKQLIKDALEEVTAMNAELTSALAAQQNMQQKRESDLLVRLANVEAANEAFLEEKNKMIQKVTQEVEEQRARADHLDQESKLLLEELALKKKQTEHLTYKYQKMVKAMSGLQQVIYEATDETTPRQSDQAPDSFGGQVGIKSRAAMRESAEICLSTFSDLSKALGETRFDQEAGNLTKSKQIIDPPSALKALPQASMQRVRERSDSKPPKPSTHDLVSAALNGRVSDSLIYEANAVFNKGRNDEPFRYKQGSAQAAISEAISASMCDLSDNKDQ